MTRRSVVVYHPILVLASVFGAISTRKVGHFNHPFGILPCESAIWGFEGL